MLPKLSMSSMPPQAVRRGISIRSNGVSFARGCARIHSMPSPGRRIADLELALEIVQPNRIDAGLEGNAACSLRTVAWSLSNSVSRWPSATIVLVRLLIGPAKFAGPLEHEVSAGLLCRIVADHALHELTTGTGGLREECAQLVERSGVRLRPRTDTTNTIARRLTSEFRLDSGVTCRHENLAVTVALHWRHQPRAALHVLEQARGPVVADAKVALDHEMDARRFLMTISTAWSYNGSASPPG